MIGIGALGLAFLAWERARPARTLPSVPGWWPRLLLANATQLAVVLAIGPLTASVLDPLVPLDPFPNVVAGTIAYLLSTFLWYWWHRARHEVRPLWLACHQLHHSPSRIEAAMAFYKHPLEQAANALLAAAVAGPLFGLDPGAALVYATLSAGAEFVYHVNVRTPRWLGYLVQRPEMHRLHHARGHHAQNYGDLPVWDMLFGTYANPETWDGPCGFEDEHQVGAMLLFQDIHAPGVPLLRSLALTSLTILGLASVGGTLLTPVAPRLGAAVAGVGKLSLASPFPKVFCQFGDTEPWTWDHTVTVTWEDASVSVVPLDRATARRHVGPYPYRNAYGAAVAYGSLLPADTVTAVLTHAACQDPRFLEVLGLPEGEVRQVRVDSYPPGAGAAPRHTEIAC